MKKILLKLVIAASLSLPAASGYAAAMLGLTTSNQVFVMANASNPSVISGPYAVSGVAGGQVLVALDQNPGDKKMYALGYNSSTFQAQLYRINISGNTYTAVAVGSSPVTLQLGSGTSVGFDFNATNSDDITVVSSDGSNSYTLDVTSGAVLNTGGNVSYASGDINSSITAQVGAMAYMNSFYGADATMGIGFDLANNAVVSFDQNNGSTIHTIGLSGLLINNSDGVGMDIYHDASLHTNDIYLSATTILNSGAHLYSVNANTGFAMDLGPIGSGSLDVADIALEIDDNSGGQVTGNVLIGLTLNLHNLVFFDSDNPGNVIDVMSIDGMTSGQTMVAIDFSPENGLLYGLGFNISNNQYQLYTIDINTNTNVATATAVNTNPSSLSLTTTGNGNVNLGFDFNPLTNDIRVVSGNGLNVMLDANTGLISADSSFFYGSGDVNAGANVNLGAVAHTNSYFGATTTTLVGIDLATGSLVNFDDGGMGDGSVTGMLSTILSLSAMLGSGNDANGSMDVYYDANSTANVGYMTVNDNGYDEGVDNYGDLYEVNPTTGSTIDRGTVGNGIPITDVAAKHTAPTGIGNTVAYAQQTSLLFYPNPVASQARIELAYPAMSSVYVDVIDLRGQVMRSFSYAPGSITLDLDMSTLATGIYNVRVIENRSISNIKVVKE